MEKIIMNNEELNLTSKLGFGCGRLVGGSSLIESSKLVEQALKLGVKHFDVAPSYGLGMAEDVLGEVLGDERNITIATKVGIARPSNGKSLSVLRKYLGPILKKSRVLTAFALNSLANKSSRGMFDVEYVANSFEESLIRLKRNKIDYFLLHEPTASAISAELRTLINTMILDDKIEKIGLGFNSFEYNQELKFGTVLQKNIGQNTFSTNDAERYNIVHGVLRSSAEKIPQLLGENKYNIQECFKSLKWDLSDTDKYASAALALALINKYNDKILVSFSNVKRMNNTINESLIFINTIKDKGLFSTDE
jgi:aryl-alcohol dehydrogenase-like predicted oxidoreductase